MGVINRFLLFLYALSIAALSVGVFALWGGLLPEAEIIDGLRFILRRWETLLAALIFFLFSVHFIGKSFSRGGENISEGESDVIIHGTAGDIHVAREAVSVLAERSARSVHGVERAQAAVTVGFSGDKTTKITMDIVVDQGHNVKETADAVHSAVSQAIESILNITNCAVEISVPEISNAGALKRVS